MAHSGAVIWLCDYILYMYTYMCVVVQHYDDMDSLIAHKKSVCGGGEERREERPRGITGVFSQKGTYVQLTVTR